MQDVYSRINNICLIVLTGVAFTAALIYTRPIMVPFVIAIFAYAVVSPIAWRINAKWHMPRAVAVGATIGAFLCISAIVMYVISGSLEDFFRSADVYRGRIGEFIRWANKITASWNITFDAALIQDKLRQLPVFTMARNLSGSVFSFIGNTFLVIIFTLFLIAGEGKNKTKNALITEIRKKISRYAATKFVTSLATGALVGFVLFVCGVELAFMFGVITVLLNFIPTFGSIIATMLPMPVILLQYGFGWRLITVLIATTVIQIIIGNIIEPKIMGETMDLHPVTVLLSLMFWGLVWGIPGMFLAVPITAILKIILCRIETTKPIAELLAGRLPG